MWGLPGSYWGLKNEEWLQVPVHRPPLIVGLLGLLIVAGWFLYRALIIELIAGVPLYIAAALSLAAAIAGSGFWYLREVRGMLIVAVVQIVVASITTAWIILSLDGSSRWLPAAAGLVTVANGFKVLNDLIKKRQEGKP